MITSTKEVTLVSVYGCSVRAAGHLNQLLMDLEGDMDSHTIRKGDFNCKETEQIYTKDEMIHLTSTNVFIPQLQNIYSVHQCVGLTLL